MFFKFFLVFGICLDFFLLPFLEGFFVFLCSHNVILQFQSFEYKWVSLDPDLRVSFCKWYSTANRWEPPEEATGIKSELSDTQAWALAYFHNAYGSLVSAAASSKSFLYSSSPTWAITWIFSAIDPQSV